MVKKTRKVKRTVAKAPKRAPVDKNGRKSVCRTCGYAMVWLHGGECPLCKVCIRCGNRVRHCSCMEGE